MSGLAVVALSVMDDVIGECSLPKDLAQMRGSREVGAKDVARLELFRSGFAMRAGKTVNELMLEKALHHSLLPSIGLAELIRFCVSATHNGLLSTIASSKRVKNSSASCWMCQPQLL